MLLMLINPCQVRIIHKSRACTHTVRNLALQVGLMSRDAVEVIMKANLCRGGDIGGAGGGLSPLTFKSKGRRNLALTYSYVTSFLGGWRL